MTVSTGSRDYLRAWEDASVVQYYTRHRQKPDEVYDSEKLLFDCLRPGIKVLDVGCAASGFCGIIAGRQPDTRYCGLDISRPLLHAAREHDRARALLCARGEELPFRARSFDLVFCLGLLHLNPPWREMLREMWRVAADRLVFDVRLTEQRSEGPDFARATQNLVFDDTAAERDNRVPYLILNREAFLAELPALAPGAQLEREVGYKHRVAPTVSAPLAEVYMGTFCLKRMSERGRI